MVSYALVDAFTRVPREEAVERLKHAIAVADGVISDFAFFGREAMRLTVELDASGLSELRRELEGADVELLPRSAAELDSAKAMTPGRPLLALLHVMFLPQNSAVAAHP
jgi:hypothetical protein